MSFFSTMAQGLTSSRPARFGDAPPALRSAHGTVRVWHLNVERWAGCPLLERAWAVLTEAERTRAGRLRRPVARAEFIAGRGCLRLLLAASIQAQGVACDARTLPLEPGTHGKLRLAAPFAAEVSAAGVSAAGVAAPEFNLAHARGQVLIALSLAGPVGIDLEYRDEAVEALEVAQASFAPAEVAAMERAATERERLELFYRIWTRKEAIAKADGRGLRLALDSFSVLAPGGLERGGERSLALGTSAEQATYYLRDLKAEPGFAAAIALTRPRIPVWMSRLTANDVLEGEFAAPSAMAAGWSRRGNPECVTDWEVPAGQRRMVTVASPA